MNEEPNNPITGNIVCIYGDNISVSPAKKNKRNSFEDGEDKELKTEG